MSTPSFEDVYSKFIREQQNKELLAELDAAALNSAGTYYGDLAAKAAAAIRFLLDNKQ